MRLRNRAIEGGGAQPLLFALWCVRKCQVCVGGGMVMGAVGRSD